jgi:flagellar biosynthesis/type III secretory pathway M-ring protein FliF/YscJ
MSGDLIKVVIGGLLALVGWFAVDRHRLARKAEKEAEARRDAEQRANVAEVDCRVAGDLGGDRSDVIGKALRIAGAVLGRFRRDGGGGD